MDRKAACLACLLITTLAAGVNSQDVIGAYFNMAGVVGNIDFSIIGQHATSVVVNLSGLSGFTDWEIREFPVVTTEGMSCDDTILGERLHNLGLYKSLSDVVVGESITMDNVSVLLDNDAILGRSILLKSGDKKACATIQGSEPVSFAIVNGPMAGTVHARRIGNRRFSLLTDLFSTTASASALTTIKVYNGSVNVDLPNMEKQVVSVGDRCTMVAAGSSLLASFNNVPVAALADRKRSMRYVHSSAAEFDFSRGSVVIINGNDISCANFHLYESKTVKAVFSRDGVNGVMSFTQNNPYQPTKLTVDLKNLQGRGGGYHVHLYPLPHELSPEADLCGSTLTGGHFNPFSAGSTGQTQDEREIGDLSGKHGSLADISLDINVTYTDLYLPLFGRHSIVGRSIVIHAPTGARWMCANIGYPGPVIVAKAEFNGDVEGAITFVQEEGKPWGDTSLIVEMSDSGSTSESSINHNYHIHSQEVGDDYMTTDGRCSSTGPHWNPYSAPVSDKTIYSQGCTANKLACEVGDLNGKFGEKLDIVESPSVSRKFYTDDIPLSGAYSVIRRSVTIHMKNAAAPRYVCADIKRKLTPVVRTGENWSAGTSTTDFSLSGSIVISSTGLPSAAASLNVNLMGLKGKAGGYHIHVLPLNKQNPGSNICSTTSGHYNPLGAANWQGQNHSLDKFEIGDLSNKFGLLSDLNSHQFQNTDTNLPLSGPNSVVGRSVVVHQGAPRWGCVNTIWDTQAMAGTLLKASAHFNGDINGHIELSQVISADGGESEVTVDIMLWYGDEAEPATNNHNWHVHVSTISEGACGSAGGHYNPFNIDVASANYKTQCSPAAPRKCELGDMSGKLSKLSIGTKSSPSRYIFNDMFLSLTGKFSVMGRSIVIHAGESGAPRVACADIQPMGALAQRLEYQIFTPKGAFKDDMADAIAESVGADNYHSIYVNKGPVKGNCTVAEVFFAGVDAMSLKESFNPERLIEAYRTPAACSQGINGQQEILASFNMSGVTGTVEFRSLSDTKTRTVIDIQAGGAYTWEIREYPVLTTDASNCENLGARLHDLTSALNVINEATQLGTTIDLNAVSLLNGDQAILGRSLLLTSGDKKACATIQGPEPLSFATINGRIAGNVHVRQVGSRYAVFTELFNTRSTQATPNARLKVYKGRVNADLPGGHSQEIALADRCSNNAVSTIDMVTEIENVPVAAAGSIERNYKIVKILDTDFDFSGGWLKIGEDNDVTCANFHLYESKTVKAVFSRDGVLGEIAFTQENPYKPTQVSLDFKNLKSQAGGYHVHLYPMPYEMTETNLCGSDSTGGHFNPFSAGTTSLTQDGLEIGDLSRKHGFLTGVDNINMTSTDMYLPLFGRHSIVGRSIVIHNPTGARWMCANIGYPGPVIVAKAEFNGDVEGYMTFVQEENKPWSDTSIVIKMSDAGAEKQETLNHNYHIHKSPVGDDFLSETGRCASTSGHWNPYEMDVKDSVYKTACYAHRLGCEVGDLSSKYNGSIDFKVSPGSSKYFYTDEIPLSGAYSVIRRSVTIHQEGKAAPRYVCADITRKIAPVVKTESMWHGPSEDDEVDGSVTMSASGLDSHVSLVNVTLSGLNSKAGGYHIHQYPLNYRKPGNNICGTTGGHFNPFAATDPKPNESLDRYEVGDLSNKFGGLNDKDSYQLVEAQDTNLPLSGMYSVVGRSVVIHEATSARWECSNTVWDTEAMNGTLVQARAEFNGEINGHVTFSQVVSVEGETAVNIQVMLWYSGDQSATNDHNWHVHVAPVEGSSCSSAKGHYNPFGKVVGSETYKEQCTQTSTRNCEMGDMSGKLGKVNIGTKDSPTRYVYNDDFLTLTGKFSVLGRSIVIHMENSGAPRVACADITPFGAATQVVEYYIKTPVSTFRSDMATEIKEEFDVDNSHNIYVKGGDVRGVCTAVSVHFTGYDSDAIKRKFNAKSLDDEYKSVDVDSCSSATGQASLVSGLLLIMAALMTITCS